jgi:hypothetical protein
MSTATMTSLTHGVPSSSCLTTHNVSAAASINAKLTATMGTHWMLLDTEVTWHRSLPHDVNMSHFLINENFWEARAQRCAGGADQHARLFFAFCPYLPRALLEDTLVRENLTKKVSPCALLDPANRAGSVRNARVALGNLANRDSAFRRHRRCI